MYTCNILAAEDSEEEEEENRGLSYKLANVLEAKEIGMPLLFWKEKILPIFKLLLVILLRLSYFSSDIYLT